MLQTPTLSSGNRWRKRRQELRQRLGGTSWVHVCNLAKWNFSVGMGAGFWYRWAGDLDGGRYVGVSGGLGGRCGEGGEGGYEGGYCGGGGGVLGEGWGCARGEGVTGGWGGGSGGVWSLVKKDRKYS